MLCTRTAVVLSLLAAFWGQPKLDRPADAVETALRERVTQYWEARSKSNLVAAYPFYEPAFRAEYSLELFLSNFQRLLRFRPQFQGIQRVEIDRAAGNAKVGVALRVRPELLNGEVVDSVNEETWLLIEGVWYRKAEAMLPAL